MTDIDTLVTEYLELTEQIEHAEARRKQLRAAFADLGVGDHATSNGAVTVQVQAPPRRFNLDRAWSMLSTEQQALAIAPDPSKVRSQLSSVLLEQCMDAGTGAPRVVVK